MYIPNTLSGPEGKKSRLGEKNTLLCKLKDHALSALIQSLPQNFPAWCGREPEPSPAYQQIIRALSQRTKLHRLRTALKSAVSQSMALTTKLLRNTSSSPFLITFWTSFKKRERGRESNKLHTERLTRTTKHSSIGLQRSVLSKRLCSTASRQHFYPAMKFP